MKSLLLSAVLFGSHITTAQNTGNKPTQILTDKLDAYLQSAAAAYRFNGNALLAVRNEVVFHKSYGVKNAAAGSLNDAGTRFPILSITKSFTAIVMLKLQEEGKLSLQDRVQKYFPDFPNGDKISLEHLLTHSSGIHNYTDNIDEGDSALVNHPLNKQVVLDIMYNNPFRHEPGRQFSYNNSGYYLAGLIMEKATGKSYEQNVRQYIF